MTLAEAGRRLKAIEKVINKIMSSKLPAETKVEMIKAQHEKMNQILEASK